MRVAEVLLTRVGLVMNGNKEKEYIRLMNAKILSLPFNRSKLKSPNTVNAQLSGSTVSDFAHIREVSEIFN